MFSSKDLYEKTSYKINENEYNYGFGKESFINDKINIIVCNPSGFLNLVKKIPNLNYFVLYLKCNIKVRKKRFFNRDKNATKKQWKDRTKQDKRDFKNIFTLLKNSNHLVIDTSDDISFNRFINKLRKIIYRI